MTFLNSLFLLALPLVLVPVLLHFLRRRQRTVVRWGAMRFLEEAVTESRSMKRPESLLLLLLRCALVIGLILALARPLMNWGQAASQSRELVVIVDDSLSTARQTDSGMVFDQIRESALKVLADPAHVGPGRIMLASGGGRWIGSQAATSDSREGQAAIAELAESQPTRGMANLVTCIQRSIRSAAQRSNASAPPATQRIVVITDGTSPAWQPGSEVALARLRSSLEASGMATQIQVMEIKPPGDSFANLAIVNLESEHSRAGIGELIRVRGEVENTGTVRSAPCRCVWKFAAKVDGVVDDKPRGETAVPGLDPGESAEITWSTRSKHAGPLAIEGLLNPDHPDDLPLDSTAATIVEIVKHVPVLVINNTNSATTESALAQELIFVTSALGYTGEKANEDYHSVFSPRIMDVEEALAEDLAAYHVIFVRGADNESPELAEKLMTEIQRGCGVWLTLDPETDCESFNDNWFRDGAGPSPLTLVPAEDTPEVVQVAAENGDSDGNALDIKIHPPSDRHPATRMLSDQQRMDLDEVTIRQHARFEPLLLGDEVSVILKSNRGRPLVIENTIGQGRVIIQSFPLSLQATTWPVTNSFVVTVHDWFEYLASPSAATFNLKSGMPIVWQYRDLSDRPAWLTLPDGTEIDLSGNAHTFGVQNDSGTFRYFDTHAGTYILRTSAWFENPREIPFHVSTAADEVRSAEIASEDHQRFLTAGGLELAESTDQLARGAEAYAKKMKKTRTENSTVTAASGRPVWHFVLPTLIGLLLLELLLAGRVGAQRGGIGASKASAISGLQPTTKKRATRTSQRHKVAAK